LVVIVRTANDIGALAIQVYQAILERRPAQIIPPTKRGLVTKAHTDHRDIPHSS
jgi:hypothetical protein